MKQTVILFLITLLALRLQAQATDILDSIQAKGTAITSFEGRLKKELIKKNDTLVQNGTIHYISPDKMAALFDDGDYMIINENRMNVDIGVFHGRFKLSRNKTMRSVSRIFLYAIQGRYMDFIEESKSTMETSQKDGLHIIRFTSKKKHFLGLGYRVVIFKYGLDDLLLHELVLIDYSDNIDTFTITEPKYGVTIDEKKFEH